MSFHMTGDFSHGVFDTKGKINGFQTMVMNSQQLTDKLIREFKKEIDAGGDPNEVRDLVFERCNASETDLLDSDARRLIREVENYYKGRI